MFVFTLKQMKNPSKNLFNVILNELCVLPLQRTPWSINWMIHWTQYLANKTHFSHIYCEQMELFCIIIVNKNKNIIIVPITFDSTTFHTADAAWCPLWNYFFQIWIISNILFCLKQLQSLFDSTSLCISCRNRKLELVVANRNVVLTWPNK